ncbi:unnamed protein product [Lathyrus sativus]|nr:unnamed protein product [Lathyrus sativus]
MAIQFVAPKLVDGEIEVEIEDEDVELEVRFWEFSIIMYVIGANLSMNVVNSYMIKFWNLVKLPKTYYNDDGYFMLKFKSKRDRDGMMMKRPYTIHNMPMILMDWKLDFSIECDMLRALPIWIKLP